MSVVEVNAPALLDLVEADAELECIGSGFTFTEGPLWTNRDGGSLLFSDMPGDTRRRWSESAGVEVVAHPSNKGNGLSWDLEGRLLICEHATSSLIRIEPDGSRTVVASHWQGKELNSPNDVVVTSDGSIVFTDPPYGRWPGFGVEREQELDFWGVYRIDARRRAALLVDDFQKPNGLCFSPDEKTLWINDTDGGHVRRFSVSSDGSLTGGEVIYQMEDVQPRDRHPRRPEAGRGRQPLALRPRRPARHQRAGELLGRILTPENVGNQAWGGDGLEDALHLHLLDGAHAAHEGRRAPHAHDELRSERWRSRSNRPQAHRLDGARHAPRRRCRRRRLEGLGRARARGQAERRREHQDAARRGAQERHAGAPHPPPQGQGRAASRQHEPDVPRAERGLGFDGGTRGMEVMPGLEPKDDDLVIEKERASAFAGTETDIVLRAMAIDTLILTGAWTNFSVESTARQATDMGYRVIVASDGTSSISDEWHNAAIGYALTWLCEIGPPRKSRRSSDDDRSGPRRCGCARRCSRRRAPRSSCGRSISTGPGRATRSCASTPSASAAPTCTSSRASGCGRGRWCSGTRAPASSRPWARTSTAWPPATA